MTTRPDRPTVLVYDPVRDVPWDYDTERALLSQVGVDLIVPETDRADEAQLRRADVLVVSEPLPVEVMDLLDRCVGILCYRVGMDNVDLDAAAARELQVKNIAGYCTDEVSDHAMMLLLASQRRLLPFAMEAVAGNWDVYQRPELFDIRRLRGQTVGVIGVGRIGSQVAMKATAFGMTVIGHDPFLHTAPVNGVELVELDELLGRSDIVILCSALNSSSRHLMDAGRIARMKQGSTLVNVARGGLVDEEALASALRSGHLAAAALDVRSTEPPDQGPDPLTGLPNVLQTQHLAATSRESHADLHAFAAQRCIELLVDGGKLSTAAHLGAGR